MFFYYVMMYILNILSAIKMVIKELKDSVFKNYYKQIKFTKGNSYYSIKQKERIFALACK